MDEIFGEDKFMAEIIWHYSWGIRTDKQWNKKHDNILCYRIGQDFIFNAHELFLLKRSIASSFVSPQAAET
jgi:adenine specific DNA methylase Mod